MVKCKRHKQSHSLHAHANNAQGDCAGCVYFSSRNCGKHGAGGSAAGANEIV